MVKGIGVDILEIERFHRSVERFGNRLLQRIFTKGEIDYCNRKFNVYQHYAARFAAKEAFSKALATGLRGSFGWKDIEVVNDALGRPGFRLHGALPDLLRSASLFLSLSHSESHVVAMVVLEEGE
jgi:holo-[acyl-carrier protein] synthase